MARKDKFTRRGFLPIIGSSLLIPFFGVAQEKTVDQDGDEEYKILLKPDGTSVKVKKSAIQKATVKKKNISNKAFLKWIGKKI